MTEAVKWSRRGTWRCERNTTLDKVRGRGGARREQALGRFRAAANQRPRWRRMNWVGDKAVGGGCR